MINKFIGLDGKEIHFKEVKKGVFKEVEVKELIGGVFEEWEEAYFIRHDGEIWQGIVIESEEYAVQQGRIWKTEAEAKRKVEIDNLIAKHRITDREVLVDVDVIKNYITVDVYKEKLEWNDAYGYTYGMALTQAGVIEIMEKVSKDEWRKFVELAR